MKSLDGKLWIYDAYLCFTVSYFNHEIVRSYTWSLKPNPTSTASSAAMTGKHEKKGDIMQRNSTWTQTQLVDQQHQNPGAWMDH
jgi:hypothetical protein